MSAKSFDTLGDWITAAKQIADFWDTQLYNDGIEFDAAFVFINGAAIIKDERSEHVYSYYGLGSIFEFYFGTRERPPTDVGGYEEQILIHLSELAVWDCQCLVKEEQAL